MQSSFTKKDRKSNFEAWIEKLKGVIFYSRLGSLYDKIQRLENICILICGKLETKGILNSRIS